jgi:hypothetical protein
MHRDAVLTVIWSALQEYACKKDGPEVEAFCALPRRAIALNVTNASWQLPEWFNDSTIWVPLLGQATAIAERRSDSHCAVFNLRPWVLSCSWLAAGWLT